MLSRMGWFVRSFRGMTGAVPDDSTSNTFLKFFNTASATRGAARCITNYPSSRRVRAKSPAATLTLPPERRSVTFIHPVSPVGVPAVYVDPDKLAPVSWPVLLRQFVDHLTCECGLAENTIDAYRRDLREFIGVLDDRDICHPSRIDTDLVQSFLIRLAERKLALSTIARHLVSVKMFFRYLFMIGCVPEDLSRTLETPKKWHRLPKTLHQKQVQALMSAPQPGEPYFSRDRAILELLYATGMRVSELAGLRLSDMNLDVGYLRCRGKGGKERIVPIGSHAISAVRQYVRGLRSTLLGSAGHFDEVFISRTGRPMDRTNIWRLVRRYACAAGIPGQVGPHTLRHCFASHLLEGGADLRIVQELLGHASVATTQIYTHVDGTRLKSLHEKCHPRQ